MLRRLHAFLKQQSRRSKKFFTTLVKDPRVAVLLNERAAVSRSQQGDTRAFARSEAQKLRDLLAA